MADQNNEEITAEQYKAQVMRQRFAESISNYEDIIATQATQIAQLKSELQRVKDEVEVPAVEANSE